MLSSRAGALAARIGPRLPMTVGPLLAAAGLLLTLRIGPDAVVPHRRAARPSLVFGLGLALLVAPLTATVLAAAPPEHAGAASGVNNAVARAAGLLAVALLPPVAGLTGEVYRDPAAFADGYRTAMLIAAGLLVVGGLLSAVAISNDWGRSSRSRVRRRARRRALLLLPGRRAPPGDRPTRPTTLRNEMTDDRSILSHIHELVAEEKRLRAPGTPATGLDDAERERMQRLEVELDQAWDLLRQRRARAEFGDDPDTAETRPPGRGRDLPAVAAGASARGRRLSWRRPSWSAGTRRARRRPARTRRSRAGRGSTPSTAIGSRSRSP